MLHGEVMAAVSNLADEDEETGEGGEKKTRKKKSGPDYKSILGSSNFTIKGGKDDDLVSNKLIMLV